jgi:hypothetical protein
VPDVVSMIQSTDGTTVTPADYINTIANKLLAVSATAASSPAGRRVRLDLYVVPAENITGGSWVNIAQYENVLQYNTTATISLTGAKRIFTLPNIQGSVIQKADLSDLFLQPGDHAVLTLSCAVAMSDIEVVLYTEDQF